MTRLFVRGILLAAITLTLHVALGETKTNLRPAIQAWLSNNTVTAGRSRGTAPIRHALLIGINTYEPSYEEMRQRKEQERRGTKKKSSRGSFVNLDGCVNDVEEMRGMLIARFGFKDEDILVLTNQLATRDGILDACKKHLVDASRPGATVLFFYAGHGSQIVNTKSEEPDKRDETIVPADSWAGVPDIRDKELRVLLNGIIDKGAVLTAIFDSCHSGSVARGLIAPVKSRHAAPILEDIADATNYGPSPEERGGLIIAAAQDDQPAEEQNASTTAHGAFTAALLEVLRTAPVTSPASEIFMSVCGVLQASGHSQVPVLAGSEARRRAALFGGLQGVSGKVCVGVTSVNAAGEVTLQGGRAAGLNIGCKLIRADTNRPPATLHVTSVTSLMTSKAVAVEGRTEDVRPGDIFHVNAWTVMPETRLKVWIPEINQSAANSAVKLAHELHKSGAVDLVDDPLQFAPTHFLFWKNSGWQLTIGDAASLELGANIDTAKLAGILTSPSGRSKLFISLPLSPGIGQKLNVGRDRQNSGIEIVDEASNADYMLVGSFVNGALRYAWIRPNTDFELAANSPLPAHTYWFPTNGQVDVSENQIASQLRDSIARIGKIKGWLTLSSPDEDGTFPYRLAFKNTDSNELVDGRGLATAVSPATGQKQTQLTRCTVKDGERYSLMLHADNAALAQGCSPRYIYVFSLDAAGRSQLLWPRNGQGNSQRFPPATLDGGSYPEFIPLNVNFRITPPYGIDTYILLTSVEPIPDATVLEFDGVSSSMRGAREENPLQRLLRNVGNGTRGMEMEVPANWSIQRITLRSVAR